MREYSVVFKDRTGQHQVTQIYAVDRSHAKECVAATYRPQKIISAKVTPMDRTRLKPALASVAAPSLLDSALERMRAAPFSGISVANYLKVVVAEKENFERAVMNVIRAVEAYEDKLSANLKRKGK